MARVTKAAQQARVEFEERYGYLTRDVVEALEQGEDPYDVIDHWDHSSIPAIHAHYTRGTYDAYVAECNF